MEEMRNAYEILIGTLEEKFGRTWRKLEAN
jgi:hypothetical protein